MANITSGANTGKGMQGDQIKDVKSQTVAKVKDIVSGSGAQENTKQSVYNILNNKK